MTAKQAAKELGLSSELTIQNWLKGGHFPGARKRGRYWTFDPAEVARVKADMEATRGRNRTGNWRPVNGDAGEPPFL
jgi:hypothetical protein